MPFRAHAAQSKNKNEIKKRKTATQLHTPPNVEPQSLALNTNERFDSANGRKSTTNDHLSVCMFLGNFSFRFVHRFALVRFCSVIDRNFSDASLLNDKLTEYTLVFHAQFALVRYTIHLVCARRLSSRTKIRK